MIFVLTINHISAQIIISDDSSFAYRIKLVESFMTKFSAHENDLALFDYTMLGNPNDSVYKAAQDFCISAKKYKATLNYPDTNWFAVANCHGLFKGKGVDFVLILGVETYGQDQFKWVLLKAQGDVFSMKPQSPTTVTTISPLAHETNFMELGRFPKDHILSIRHKNFILDETSVFYSFVNSGLLEIEYVSELSFVFFQVPGWMFTIREFDRLSKNSGWLIDRCSKMDENKKISLMKNLYSKK